MIIMMMSSTSMTSTSGVTLMSDLTPLPPPSCIAIVTTPSIRDSRLRFVIDVSDRTISRITIIAIAYAVFLMK